MTKSDSLPVVIIGGGPVGLAAAAHLHERGAPFVLLEAGDSVGAVVRRWSHVRMFSPWKFNLDRAAERLLAATDWVRPPADSYPTGADICDRYLDPLARHPALAPHIRLGSRVVSVTRERLDRLRTGGRQQSAFRIRIATDAGEVELAARAVIDASGTWDRPSPVGGSGVPALGERTCGDRISVGIPDPLGRDRARFADKRTAVVGSGHSAMNVLLDLVRLAETAPETRIDWIIRKRDLRQVFGGGAADQLAERGKLGDRVRALVEGKRVTLATAFAIDRIEQVESGLVLRDGERAVGPVDEIVATTGFRPDFSALTEIRLELDPITEAPVRLAPLIDPNVHSCGTVPPHGAAELAHPETDFYLVGMKSYGRAPTFLLLTGYEQVRSVVAELTGDKAAAAHVELVLPETGVCSTDHCCDDDCCGDSAQSIGAKTCCEDTCCP